MCAHLLRAVCICFVLCSGDCSTVVPAAVNMKARETFLKSLAGLCVVSHVLGINDRHGNNIHIKQTGMHAYQTLLTHVSRNEQMLFIL